jgi:hypothetical protein
MKPRNKFLIGFLTATLTFAGLWASIGPRHCNYYPQHGMHQSNHHHGCQSHCGEGASDNSSTTIMQQSENDNK